MTEAFSGTTPSLTRWTRPRFPECGAPFTALTTHLLECHASMVHGIGLFLKQGRPY